jgi:ATP-dependent Clp protease protease subunit
MDKDFEKFYRSRNPYGMSYFRDFTKKTNGMISPYIIEEHELNVAQMDVFSRLMKDRQIMFGTDVNPDTANIIVSQLLYLNSISDEEITMYVNSPGGNVYDGNGILDTMAFIKADVRTICTGLAASMGSMIIMCGTRGKRSALPMSRIMIHQPLGGCEGQATEIAITYNELMRVREELYGLIVQRTKQPIEKVREDCERDHWLTAEQAKDYGIIDEVIKVKRD